MPWSPGGDRPEFDFARSSYIGPYGCVSVRAGELRGGGVAFVRGGGELALGPGREISLDT